VSPRDAARALNAGRIALGLSLVLAPRLTARTWIGDDAERPGTRVVLRAHGIRDALLGALALHTVDAPQVGPRYQATLAVVDAVDFAATVAARRSLPRAGAVLVAAMAAAGVAGQLWVAERLRAAAPEDGDSAG
jgi:hypothetical protein